MQWVVCIGQRVRCAQGSLEKATFRFISKAALRACLLRQRPCSIMAARRWAARF